MNNFEVVSISVAMLLDLGNSESVLRQRKQRVSPDHGPPLSPFAPNFAPIIPAIENPFILPNVKSTEVRLSWLPREVIGGYMNMYAIYGGTPPNGSLISQNQLTNSRLPEIVEDLE